MVSVFQFVPDCWKKEESCLRYHSEAAFFLGGMRRGHYAQCQNGGSTCSLSGVIGQMACLFVRIAGR